MSTLTIVDRDPVELKPYHHNVRTHSKKQIRQIAASITEFGFNQPVMIDEHGQILAGHGRVAAAKLLGLSTVPTIQHGHLSDAQKRAYILADNKLAANAGWNRKYLQVELQGLIDEGFEIAVTGFETPEIDLILHDLDDEQCSPDDLIPEKADGPTITQPGDRWQLDDHILLCGSATDQNSYPLLMDGAKADLVFTDPPYNVPLQGNVSGHGKTQHREFTMGSGEMIRPQFTSFLQTVFGYLVAHTINGSIHFICIDWRHLFEMTMAGEAVFSELKNVCVWNKSNGGLGSFYRSKHELVFVWKSGTAAHINNFELGQHGRLRTNVWDYAGVNSFRKGRMDELELHPTVKPVAMVIDALRDCSRRGSVVLDPFCGSGTILIAAERTGRRARALEIDPAYVDVAVRRWQTFAGQNAVLTATGETFEAVAERRAAPQVAA